MSSGYIPLFGSLTTGTLCGKWPDVGLWPIVLSLSDRHGVVDVTSEYIARITGLAVDEVTTCMRRFCEPDVGSRSPAEDGARLVLVDPAHRSWGWRIVNHGKYREKTRLMAKDAARTESGKDAERKRAKRSQAQCPPVSPAFPLSDSYSYSYSDSNRDKKKTRKTPAKPTDFHRQVIDAYLRLCPGLRRIKGWPKHRREALDARIRERCADGKPANTIEWWEDFFKSVAGSDFLCGRTRHRFRNCDIDWLLGPKNFMKVVEDKFLDDQSNGANPHG